jgi:hypothetical protein
MKALRCKRGWQGANVLGQRLQFAVLEQPAHMQFDQACSAIVVARV